MVGIAKAWLHTSKSNLLEGLRQASKNHSTRTHLWVPDVNIDKIEHGKGDKETQSELKKNVA